MSEKRFQDAKGNLAFTQSLLDKHRASKIASQNIAQPFNEGDQQPVQQAPEQPTEAPQAPQNAPEQPQQEESGIIKAVKAILAPIVKKVEDLLSKKDEPKETVLKIDATAEPKDEKDDSK